MKKLIIFSLVIFLITGCFNNEKVENLENNVTNSNKEPIEEKEEVMEYQDLNPLKISLYQKKDGYYERKDTFKTNLEAYKDIGLFSVIYDNQEKVLGTSINSLYKEYSNTYQEIEKYKIGYNIKFLVGTKEYNETILKPLDVFDYSFSDYLYIWLYDDINNSGNYSHLEIKDYNDKTIMSSIKLMATELTKDITSNIEISAFTYDSEDDFLEDNTYRGNSIFTMKLEKIE